MELALVLAVIVVALAFDYTNGFHDAANAIATSISTRALTPRLALTLAAVMNFAGAFLGQEVANTVSEVIDPPSGTSGLVVVIAALLGAITWNLITWYFGLPSSSSQALIGGLVGAALASGSLVHWQSIWDKVLIPMVASPVVGFIAAFLVMLAIMWIFRRRNPGRVNRGFKLAQVVLRLGDGPRSRAPGRSEDDGRDLPGAGHRRATPRPERICPGGSSRSAATAISLGTYSGGWRIMRTMGRRIIHLDPPRAFSAEATAASHPLHHARTSTRRRSPRPTSSPPASWDPARPGGARRSAGGSPAAS